LPRPGAQAPELTKLTHLEKAYNAGNTYETYNSGNTYKQLLNCQAQKNKAGFFSFFGLYPTTGLRAKLAAGRTFAPRK
jgi:hypothetical protein